MSHWHSIAILSALAATSLLLFASILPNHSHSSALHPKTISPFSDGNIVVGLRSGKETIQRAKVLLETLYAGYDKLVIFSDAGDHLMGHKVHNVLGNLPYSIKQRRGGSNSQEDIKPSWGQSNKKGWIRDAHKFLPALKLLFKEHPNAPWYLLVDDDAYINLKGYEQQLNQFNSSEPYYAGFVMDLWHCGTADPRPQFVHGGGGIAVSNGAMRKLHSEKQNGTTFVDECIENSRLQNCEIGDGRLGLCMRDLGIIPTQLKRLYALGPDTEFYGLPCEVPCSYHKLSPNDIRRLDRLVRKSQNGMPTFSDVYHEFHPWNASTTLPLVGYNIDGDEFQRSSRWNGTECMLACDSESECIGYEFWHEKQLCIFKKMFWKQPIQTMHEGVSSGYFGKRVQQCKQLE